MKKIILITRISNNGDNARYAFGNTGRYFAKKYISEDGGATFTDLPSFPTDSRLNSIRGKAWYSAIGEFIFFGNNRREVLQNMQPENKTNITYRIADADDINDRPYDFENKIIYS